MDHITADDLFNVLRQYIPEQQQPHAINHIIQAFAGGVITIPATLRNRQRDADIVRQFNGPNWKFICTTYGISRVRLYEIVRKHKNIMGKTVENHIDKV